MFSIVTSISDDWQRRDIGGSPKDDVGPSAIFEAEWWLKFKFFEFEAGFEDGGSGEESSSCEHGGPESEPVQHPATDAGTVTTVIVQNYF